jgi:hypothetical protein
VVKNFGGIFASVLQILYRSGSTSGLPDFAVTFWATRVSPLSRAAWTANWRDCEILFIPRFDCKNPMTTPWKNDHIFFLTYVLPLDLSKKL